jgi:hypothetical protein
MGSIAGRLDNNPGEVGRASKNPRCRKRFNGSSNVAREDSEHIHDARNPDCSLMPQAGAA